MGSSLITWLYDYRALCQKQLGLCPEFAMFNLLHILFLCEKHEAERTVI
jgi:hypothetical protein